MKFIVEIENTENFEDTPNKVERYKEIITALITKGALDGVRGGQTIIHFNSEGEFMGVQLSYWPYRRKKKLTTEL